uniref:Uncharacterized protein n=1 Tax=Amphimedon queenslandica TaxID=400682 RepID=A0A1X7TTE2_AMPQE
MRLRLSPGPLFSKKMRMRSFFLVFKNTFFLVFLSFFLVFKRKDTTVQKRSAPVTRTQRESQKHYTIRKRSAP